MNFAVSLMNVLSYRKKMAVIAAVFLIPLTVSFVLLVSEINKKIDASNDEIQGLEYIKSLHKLYQHIPEHRGMVNAFRNGQTSYKDKITSKRKEISADIAAIDVYDTSLGKKFNTSGHWREIKNEWQQLLTDSSNSPNAPIFKQHTKLIHKIYDLFDQISVGSGLELDPQLDTDFIIHALVYDLPRLSENLAQAHFIAAEIATQNPPDISEQNRLDSLLGQIEDDRVATHDSLANAFENDPTLSSQLNTVLDKRHRSFQAFTAVLKKELLQNNDIEHDPSQLADLANQAIDSNNQLYNDLVPVLRNLLNQRNNGMKMERMELIGTMFIVIAIVLYLFAGFYRSIMDVIQNLVNATNQIAQGDLTVKVTSNANDESKQIVDSLNHMTEHLNKVMVQLSSNSSMLAAASEELSATTSQARTNTNEQQSQTEQIATAMNEMSSTIKEIASHAELLAAEVRNADSDTQAGKQVISETISSINKLAEGVGNAAAVVHQLTQSSEEIGSVLTVIKSVAEQTNLLALNAAIEAARAGEQGRGFAVVADEVRTLASRTQDSAEQIQKMIDNLQQHTKEAADVMATEQENAQNMSQYTESATQSIDNIVNSMTRISDMSTHVASAAEEQGLVSDEINRNVTQVSDLSTQNMDGSEQISTASHDLARLAAELETIVKRFKV